MKRIVALLSALLMLLAMPAAAATRAWLDRDRVALGETVTLNVESDTRDAPDYGPLVRDFDLGAQGSREEIDWTGAGVRTRALFAVALRPRHDGLIRIPPLRVGAGVTAPLTLLVTPAPSAPPPGRSDVFIESEADDQDPYVQQSVGWVVRLYSATPLIAGSLDQDAPAGASLQRVGEDRQYRASVGGREYTVVERRYLLVPERSGELAIPPARFEGRGAGDPFDRLFGDGQAALRAVARPRILRVQPIPAHAPRPWLPLRALALRYAERPTRARAGEAVTVVIDAEADGAGAAQMPALELGAVDGVQVFPERAQADESFADGRPRAHVRRRFSLVPTRAGVVVVPGPRIAWWDSQAGVARVASLPPTRLDVAPGAAGTAGQGAVPATPLPAATTRGVRWPVLAGLGALALLLVLFAVRRRVVQQRAHAAPLPDAPFDAGAAEPASRASAPDRPRGPDMPPAAPAPRAAPPLADALAADDLAAIDHALRAASGQGDADLDAVLERLDDPAQRDAVDALRRARWAGGDAADALARLRRAFAGGPAWRGPDTRAADALPPLYPAHPRRD